MKREKLTIRLSVRLRPAQTSDTDFLAALYASTRADELQQFGMSPEQQAAFCAFQFRLQTEAYKMQFPDAVDSIVEINGRAGGRVLVGRDEKEIRLIDVALLPEFRGCGAGTAIIEDLQKDAEVSKKPLNLRVLTTNDAAVKLYEKLGFKIIETSQTHFSMQWRAS